MLLRQFSIKTLNNSKRLNKVVSACQQLLLSPNAKLVKEYLDDRLSSSAQNDFQFGYFPPLEELKIFTKYIRYRDWETDRKSVV